MPKVLFVCTGNTCRSVMAEIYFRHKAAALPQKTFEARSAGTSSADGFAASGGAVRTLAKYAMDGSRHRSTQLTTELIHWADRIYVMESGHKQWILRAEPSARGKTFLLTDFSPDAHYRDSSYGVPDPVMSSDGFYQETFDLIKACVDNIFNTFTKESS